MALKTVKKYNFQDSHFKEKRSFFELTCLQMDTRCTIFEDEVNDYYRIFWIEEGSGEYSIDLKEIAIRESGVFCLTPGQVFQVKNEQLKSAYLLSFDREFYCVEAHGKEIACNGLLFNNVHRAAVVEVDRTHRNTFQSLIQQMIDEFETKGSAHQEMLESYLRLFLIHTLRLVDQQEAAEQTSTHQQDRLVQDFIALVEKQFRKVHTVTAYAEQLFISPKTLAKRLHSLGYPTPLQLIRDRILLEAKRQLRYSSQTIKEIAYDLGFDDPNYFSRLFSKAEGIAPANYRKQVQF